MNLAIFEPDIPQNTGAMIRICSCFDVDIDIIHPASFVLSEKSLNRVAMDYIKNVKISEFDDWEDYMTKRNGRKILLSTKGSKSHYDFSFNQTDNLIVGRESAGVPEYVHQDSDEVLKDKYESWSEITQCSHIICDSNLGSHKAVKII